MNFLRRIFKKHRRYERLEVRLPVRMGTRAAEGQEFWTEDLSEGGLRMDITGDASLGELMGGHRDVELRIPLEEGSEPVRVMAEPVWTLRTEDNRLSSGWVFCRYYGDAQERISARIQGQGRSGEEPMGDA